MHPEILLVTISNSFTHYLSLLQHTSNVQSNDKNYCTGKWEHYRKLQETFPQACTISCTYILIAPLSVRNQESTEERNTCTSLYLYMHSVASTPYYTYKLRDVSDALLLNPFIFTKFSISINRK